MKREIARTDSIPICGVICLVAAILAIVAPIVVSPLVGFEIDIYLRHWFPYINPLLAVLAFLRREPKLWAIVGLLLTAIYYLVHTLAVA